MQGESLEAAEDISSISCFEETVSDKLLRGDCFAKAASGGRFEEVDSRWLFRGGCFEKAALDCFEEITSEKLSPSKRQSWPGRPERFGSQTYHK